jgi:glycosyltransferase involved in cell wall biosynthesis
VLAQTHAHLELIVIDDGSTDGSARVLEAYRGRFHWEIQSNQGQAATLNRGWRGSRGEILGYLSADDLLARQAVTRSIAVLERNPDAVLTYCDFDLIDPRSAVIRRVRTREFDQREMLTQMICHPGPGAFFRRAAFETAGGWSSEYRQFGDYELWLRLALQGRFVRIAEVLASFRVHPASQSYLSRESTAAEPVKIVAAYFENRALPKHLTGAKSQALSAAYLSSAQLNFRAGNYSEGFSAARRALTLYPRNLFAARTLRLAFNALFNRLGHRLLWTLRGLLR